MIVCSCNVLTDTKIKATLDSGSCPRTPGALYKCLGCNPNCRRCFATVRKLIDEALNKGKLVAPVDCSASCSSGDNACDQEMPSMPVVAGEQVLLAADSSAC
ncbi:(2Fe-2S)-binding protein [Beijerinckia mobilis]|uniref:(2Fe-2S)-binding protein n=1 Tax=Beijerinckia mobilis TaxID=231434 RepID=UPI001AEC3D24|nr:(2Fe-2S)-binding protein [Beijerinckia mobilis]